MTTETVETSRFEQLSDWLRQQIGLARSAQHCDACARSLLEDAERELGDMREDLLLFGPLTSGLAGASGVFEASGAVETPPLSDVDQPDDAPLIL